MLIKRIYTAIRNGKIDSIKILSTDTSYEKIESKTDIGKNMQP
jgi:hypothetical protein